ncbi:hypothetical protein, partial [Collinsella sp. Sow4_E3]|uniref:hypothetical protein n=1 Tax=Collinsella sp. Sow4_E3 TaxID=3438776 RepID=UPI003F9193EC
LEEPDRRLPGLDVVLHPQVDSHKKPPISRVQEMGGSSIWDGAFLTTLYVGVVKKAPSQISCPKRTSPAPTMATSQVEHKSASAVQNVRVGMKKARHRPFGHALPFE